MVRFVFRLAVTASLAMLQSLSAQAGGSNYERTYPPHIVSPTPGARLFYAEFRARNESGGLGHSYVTLGTIATTGELQESVVAGFMPKSADDDYWAQFGMPVTGIVGVALSDYIHRLADVSFRIAISKIQYYQVVHIIYSLKQTWTTYHLLMQNCNSFAGEIANSIGLRTPMVTVQYPVHCMAELRALNTP
jgi:hypothetical protein